jgi:lipopolysaccharide export system protein LptC
VLKPKDIDKYFIEGSDKTASVPVSVHSRRVAVAKAALPSLAAVLALILLVFPALKKETKEFGVDFVITAGDIEKMNIEKTTVYVTDKNNRVNNFVASRINETSAGSQTYDLEKPEALLPLDNDEWINISSPRGEFSQQTNILHLQDKVDTYYSRGMTLQTGEAFFDFKKSFGYTHAPVTGDGFIGHIEAEGLEIDNSKNILYFLGKTDILINEENLRKE